MTKVDRRTQVEGFLTDRSNDWDQAASPDALRGLAKLARIDGLYSWCSNTADVEAMLWQHIVRLRG